MAAAASSSSSSSSSAAERLVESGRIMYVGEIEDAMSSPSSPSLVGRAVRTLGRVLSYAADEDQAVVEFEGRRLAVSARLLDGAGQDAFVPGALYQFIGDVRQERSHGMVVVDARVCRNVDGMDVEQYKQCLEVRRRFEARQEK